MAPCRRLRFNLSGMYPVPRLGIAQLASLARSLGHTVHLVDVIAEGWTDRQFGAWCREVGADLVGVSATIASMREAFDLCAAAKATCPAAFTVVGGPGTGGWSADALFEHSNGAVDVFVRGEGEAAFEGLLRGGSWDDVPNLVRPGGDNPVAGAIALDAAPAPAWDLMPMEYYRLHPPMGVYPYATLLETARGCNYPCNFCCLAGLHRTREVDWIVDQIEHLHHRYGANEVHFVDPTFTLDRERRPRPRSARRSRGCRSPCTGPARRAWTTSTSRWPGRWPRRAVTASPSEWNPGPR